MHPSHHARTDPVKPALVMAETGDTLTYGDLDIRSNRGAHLLRSLGLASSDTIALMMVNGALLIELVWAAQRAELYSSQSRQS